MSTRTIPNTSDSDLFFFKYSYSAPISVDVEYTRGKEVVVRKGKDGKQEVRFRGLFVSFCEINSDSART